MLKRTFKYYYYSPTTNITIREVYASDLLEAQNKIKAKLHKLCGKGEWHWQIFTPLISGCENTWELAS